MFQNNRYAQMLSDGMLSMTDDQLNDYCLELMTNEPQQLLLMSFSPDVQQNHRLKTAVDYFLSCLDTQQDNQVQLSSVLPSTTMIDLTSDDRPLNQVVINAGVG